MAYSEVQKALALEIVRRNGGQVSASALTEIRVKLNLPHLNKVTVWGWVKDKNKPDEEKSIELKSQEVELEVVAAVTLDKMFEDAARMYIRHAQQDHIVARANASQAMTAAAIAVDKMRLLRDLPTEIIGVLPQLTEISKRLAERNMKFSDVVEAMFQKLASEDANASQE